MSRPKAVVAELAAVQVLGAEWVRLAALARQVVLEPVSVRGADAVDAVDAARLTYKHLICKHVTRKQS